MKGHAPWSQCWLSTSSLASKKRACGTPLHCTLRPGDCPALLNFTPKRRPSSVRPHPSSFMSHSTLSMSRCPVLSPHNLRNAAALDGSGSLTARPWSTSPRSRRRTAVSHTRSVFDSGRFSSQQDPAARAAKCPRLRKGKQIQRCNG